MAVREWAPALGFYLLVCVALAVFDLATGGAFHSAVLSAITFTAGLAAGMAIWAHKGA